MPGQHEVALVNVVAEHEEIAGEVEAGWAAVLANGAFVLGENGEAFERELAAFCGVADVATVANGTDAIELALRAVGIGAGVEVVVPAFSFAATAMAVVRAGAQPRFVDVDPDTLLMDVDAAGVALADGARGVIPVHLYGQMVPMERLVAAATEHGAIVVEDAAQAIGATQNGRPPAHAGSVAATSFYPSKTLGAYGDGGAVLCSRPVIAARVRALRNHGLVAGNHEGPGWNSRLDELQAVVLRAKLRRLSRWLDARRGCASRYDELLADLARDGRIVRPVVLAGNVHAWHLYVVRVPGRDAVVTRMREAGIRVGVHYRTPLPELPGLRHRATGQFPNAERASREVMSLPISGHLAPSDQTRVVEELTHALRH